MKKLYTTLLILTLSLSNLLTATAQQSPCATVNVSKALEAVDATYAREREEMIAGREQRIENNLSTRDVQAIRKVSVVVHVVYNSGVPAQNVSDNAIATLISTLNADFSRTNSDASATRSIFQSVAASPDIEFCLDQTIRVATSHACYSTSTQTNDMKYTNQGGSNAVDPDHFLNIWIVDICGGTNSGTAGYAYLPTPGMVGSNNDGLVIDYSLGMGSGSRTATHEIGHYFNLCHTWSCDDNAGCSNDDGFTDTPQSNDANYPSFTACFDPTVNSCTSGNPDLVDQTENFMDYATCPNMFTIQQCAEINSILSNERADLLLSTGCSSQTGSNPVADFIGVPTSGTPGTTVNFTDQTTNSPTSWAWNFGDPGSGGLNTSTSQNPSHTYNSVGLYTVSLTATNGSGSDTRTRTNYININTGGGGTGACDTIWNPSFADPANEWNLIPSVGGGYVSGTNGYGDLAKAQAYTPVNSTSYISDIIVMFGDITTTSGNPNSSVAFVIYDMDGTGTTTGGTVTTAPGTILGAGSIAVTQLTTSQPMLIGMPSTVTVTGPYAVGVDFSLLSAGDSVAVVSTSDGDAGNTELAWEQLSDGSWVTMLASWPLDVDLVLVPIECDQLPVGIATQVEANEFYIFPNPTSNVLNVVSGSDLSNTSLLSIIDISGQLISETTLTNKQTAVDVSQLAAGIYFAKLTTASKTKTLKFIIAEK
jgi:PKD repeat protein